MDDHAIKHVSPALATRHSLRHTFHISSFPNDNGAIRIREIDLAWDFKFTYKPPLNPFGKNDTHADLKANLNIIFCLKRQHLLYYNWSNYVIAVI